MFGFCRTRGRPSFPRKLLGKEGSNSRGSRRCHATGVALALAVAGGLGCGEDVLVSNWALELKVADAGVEATEIDLPPAGLVPDAGLFPSYEAIRASQNARNRARKLEKEHDSRSSSSGDKSNH
jgi:hypothetical protein